MRVVFVHGACVKDGAWWWHRTAELLADRGVANEAPALPSCGESGEPTGAGGPGLAEDVAVVRQVLTANDEPTVIVAHSYGGIVTAEAAAGIDVVRHVLLVSSYLPEVGQSLSRPVTASPHRSSTSIPGVARSPSVPMAWPRRSCRTADRSSTARRWTRRRTRASACSRSRCSLRPGGACRPRTSSAPRTGVPPPGCNASTPAGPTASWNSMPATTRSSPSRPPYATWYSGSDGAARVSTDHRSWLLRAFVARSTREGRGRVGAGGDDVDRPGGGARERGSEVERACSIGRWA